MFAAKENGVFNHIMICRNASIGLTDDQQISPVNMMEVEQLIRKNSKSSTGPDGISPKFVKEICIKVSSAITTLVNTITTTGTYPLSLNQGRVTPIYKKKGDPMECENYRAISVCSAVGRIWSAFQCYG